MPDEYNEEQFADMLATGDIPVDFDPANAEAPAARDPLPLGNYWADIKTAEIKQGPKAPFIKIQLSVAYPPEPEARPWTVFENVSLSLKAKFRLDQLYAALYGKGEAGKTRLNILEMVGRSLLVHLGQERDNKGVMRNNVINFIPLDEAETVALVGVEPPPTPAETADPNQGWGSYATPAAATEETPLEGDGFDAPTATAAPPRAAPTAATTAAPRSRPPVAAAKPAAKPAAAKPAAAKPAAKAPAKPTARKK